MFVEGRRASLYVIACLTFYLAQQPLRALAAEEPYVPSPSNYGGAGLLDMPTAPFYPDCYLGITTSFTEPDDRYSITAQALPWLELTFRYSIIHPLGPLQDRSFDARFRLSSESRYLPEMALGFQDVLGTGVYSGEYLVGSKR